jgi:hypothetical protein
MKTAELSGAQLDWAVCKAAGMFEAYPKFLKPGTFLKAWQGNSSYYLHPSLDWAQGGPIIEREHLTLRAIWENGKPRQKGLLAAWRCDLDFKDGVMTLGKILEYGETPLIAAMRCYVASKLGDEVEIPQELILKEGVQHGT